MGGKIGQNIERASTETVATETVATETVATETVATETVATETVATETVNSSVAEAAGGGIATHRVISTLDEGGTSLVYLCEHRLLNSQAVLKVLKPEALQQQAAIAPYLKDIRTLAALSLDDSGIVRIFDCQAIPGTNCRILMEYLGGETLASRLRRLQRLAPEQALRISRQVATSLRILHAAGICHQNLKPSNIVLVPDAEVEGGERAKIIGFRGLHWFGLKSYIDAEPNFQQLLGLPTYMAPEQCCGAGNYDHRVDIYALGCILFHMLSGNPPFCGNTAESIATAHAQSSLPGLRNIRDPLAKPLQALIQCALAKSPQGRYPSATALLTAIEDLRGSSAMG